jgi:hypothetical protein
MPMQLQTLIGAAVQAEGAINVTAQSALSLARTLDASKEIQMTERMDYNGATPAGTRS